jgi:hypothetical protein
MMMMTMHDAKNDPSLELVVSLELPIQTHSFANEEEAEEEAAVVVVAYYYY